MTGIRKFLLLPVIILAILTAGILYGANHVMFTESVYTPGLTVSETASEEANDVDISQVVGVPIKEDFVPDEVIVKLKENRGIGSLNLDNVRGYEKITKGSNRFLRAMGLDRLYLLKVDGLERTLEKLESNPSIEYAEPNYMVEAVLTPNDPSFPSLYGLHNTGQTGGKVDADIDAPEAWDIQRGNDSVIVAVIDTGVDYNHEDLVANMWINTNEIQNNGIDDDGNGFVDDYLGWDFYNDDNDPFDDHGHGTHVSGTIGAVGNNSIGVVGVSWNVRIMPLKFLGSGGSGSTADAVTAVEYATLMNADIMSNSWGGGGYSQALRDTIEAANSAGILFVAAAGNNGANTALYPAAYDNENIVSVAATDHNDNMASFSNYHETLVDLGAPGVNIFSSVPNGSCSLCSVSGYRYLDGTSMATPHVSGVAALIKSQFPGITSLKIKSRLLGGVDYLTNLKGKTLSEGRLNSFNSLEDDSIAPGAITDLAPTGNTSGSVTFTFTATGDDGDTGTSKYYDMRYSTSMINETNFEDAHKALNLPKPQTSGSAEALTVNGLLSSTVYYFAVKAVDNVGNKGPISNIATETTGPALTSMSDDFDPDIDTSQWSEISLGKASTSCGAVSGNALYFNGAGTRQAVTNNLNITPEGYIDFELKIGTGSAPCENADLNEYVALEYSTDGITWNLINSYNEDSYPNFTAISENIPAAAYSTSTRFRFRQVLNSGNGFDNWAIDDVSIGPHGPNSQPVADANGPYSGTEDVAVLFDGSGSYDADGDALTYNWSFGDGSYGTGVNPTHTYTAGGNYSVSLVVNDGRLDSEASTTTAAIDEVNDAPVANAGEDRSVYDTDGDGIETVTLNGSGSYDIDGVIVSYEWFEGAALIASGISPAVSFGIGVHNVVLSATDDAGASGTDSVVITVNEHPADTVTITKAQYRTPNGQLTVEAVSDNADAILTLVGYGQLDKKGNKWTYRQNKIGLPDPPTVTVTSSGGGSATLDLKII